MHDIKIPTPEEIGGDPFTVARELGIVCEQFKAHILKIEDRVRQLEAAATEPKQVAKGGKHAAA